MKAVQSIGECGIDSAQLLVVDPVLFASNWKEEEFRASRRFEHVATGVEIKEGRDFRNFEFDHLEQYEGKNMNTLIREGVVKQLPYEPAKELLSYNSCCIATIEEGAKVLGDIAVVTRTGFGDGGYNVFPVETKTGERQGVQAVFIEDFDLQTALTDCDGEIKCESGLLLLADPCYSGSQQGLTPEALSLSMMDAKKSGRVQLNYDLGHAGLGVLIKVDPGMYDVYVQKQEYINEDGDNFGERVYGIALVKQPE